MDGVAMALANTLTNGGNGAIVALLIFVCYGLWAERSRLMEQNEASQKRLEVVAQAQADSTRQIVEAVSGVRLTLLQIRLGELPPGTLPSGRDGG